MKQEPISHQTSITIRPLSKKDLPVVIKIHLNLFGSQSGLRFLEKAYYPTFFHPRSTAFCLVAVSQGRVVGFCSGALNASDFHQSLARSHSWECLIAAARMVLKGSNIWRQMTKALSQLYASPINPPGGNIFFIAVQQGFRNRGIATRLVNDALGRFRSEGLKQCWSKALKSNTASVEFHTRLGFRVHPEMSRQEKDRFVFFQDLQSNPHP